MEKIPLMPVIHQLHREWSDYMKKTSARLGIPDNYCRIIMHLDRSPAPVRRICRADAQNLPAISQTVKEMLRDGYITKQTDETDQRYSKLYLTESGKALASAVADTIHGADRKITEYLTPEKEEETTALLLGLIDEIRKGTI